MIFRKIERNERVYLDCYLPDELPEYTPENGRPALLICPGGGYFFCSPREGEPVAYNFLAKGFAVFVLYYSVQEHAVFPGALLDAAWAMKTIRDNAEIFGIDSEKVAVMGFSAGGHLAASLSTMYNCREVLTSDLCIEKDEVRPNASILCYPVISGVNDTHMDSFRRLAAKEDPTYEELLKLSCEYHIDENTPPAFLWHTSDDSTVPVINSLVYAQNLAANKIPFELFIFDKGNHGLATADKYTCEEIHPEINKWMEKASLFLKKYLDVFN